MRIKKYSNLNIDTFTLKILKILCALIFLTASSVRLQAFDPVDLGELFVPTSSVAGTFFSGDYPASNAFNGVSNDPNDAWQGNTTQPGSLFWGVDPFRTVKVDLDIYDTILFTLEIYNGGGTGISPNIGNLEQFSIETIGEGKSFQTDSVKVTTFHSLTSQQVGGTEEALTISANEEGLISASTSEISDGQSMHTIVFYAPTDTRTIRIRSSADSSVEDHFSIDEINTYGVAEVIPEPSTYGLLLGGFILLIGFVRRIRTHSNIQLEK